MCSVGGSCGVRSNGGVVVGGVGRGGVSVGGDCCIGSHGGGVGGIVVRAGVGFGVVVATVVSICAYVYTYRH